MSTLRTMEPARHTAAKVAGFLYLFLMVTAIFAEFYAHGRLIVDAGALVPARAAVVGTRVSLVECRAAANEARVGASERRCSAARTLLFLWRQSRLQQNRAQIKRPDRENRISN